jgi:hypothetical protein
MTYVHAGQRDWTNGGRATSSLLILYLKVSEKSRKKIHRGSMIYTMKRPKSRYKLLRIQCYTKITNSEKLSLYNLSDFFPPLKYKVVQTEILHVFLIHHWLPLEFYLRFV